VTLKAEDILQLSTPQRKTVVSQLSQTQLQGLSSEQVAAFGLIGNQMQTQNSSQPQQEGQQSNGSIVVSDVIPIVTKADTGGNSGSMTTSEPPAEGIPVANATAPQNATAPKDNLATIVGTEEQAPPTTNVPQQQSTPMQNQAPNASGQPSQPDDQGSQAQNASQPENQAAKPGTRSSTTDSQDPDTTAEEAEKVKRNFETSSDAVRRLFREGSESRGKRWLTRLKPEREFVR
jgi:hypothetical protein